MLDHYTTGLHSPFKTVFTVITLTSDILPVTWTFLLCILAEPLRSPIPDVLVPMYVVNKKRDYAVQMHLYSVSPFGRVLF
jgi:hypothetical protein